MAQLLGVLEQGLIYAVLALGVYITFKILDFPDMTVDSSFPLGAAVTALMISNGVNPLRDRSGNRNGFFALAVLTLRRNSDVHPAHPALFAIAGE